MGIDCAVLDGGSIWTGRQPRVVKWDWLGPVGDRLLSATEVSGDRQC